MKNKKTFLSASRIKTAQQCSWTYWCKYILKLPDKSNDGASKGWICHLVFEVLGKERRKKHFDTIIKNQSIWSVESIKIMVRNHARKLKVLDEDSLSDIDRMVVKGLNYDFFGEDYEKPSKAFSEKEFNIEVNEFDKRYNIRGFIDKLFLYSDGSAIIRDFKSSKQKFKGKEITDNMQDIMYCLAIKKLYPKYKSISEFLFLKFDLEKDMLGESGPGVIKMDPLSEDVLEGFEYELSAMQNFIDNFNEEDARDNFAGDQCYPKDGTFGGPLACGKDGYKMSKGETVKDKDGNPIKAFICPFRKGFDYYSLINSDGSISKSVYKDDKESLELKIKDGQKIEKRTYDGCPRWRPTEKFEL